MKIWRSAQKTVKNCDNPNSEKLKGKRSKQREGEKRRALRKSRKASGKSERDYRTTNEKTGSQWRQLTAGGDGGFDAAGFDEYGGRKKKYWREKSKKNNGK